MVDAAVGEKLEWLLGLLGETYYLNDNGEASVPGVRAGNKRKQCIFKEAERIQRQGHVR